MTPPNTTPTAEERFMENVKIALDIFEEDGDLMWDDVPSAEDAIQDIEKALKSYKKEILGEVEEKLRSSGYDLLDKSKLTGPQMGSFSFAMQNVLKTLNSLK